MLKSKAPQNSEIKDDDKSEVEPPEAFPFEKEDNISDAETIVGEKDDMCKEMKDCLAKFANFAVNSPDDDNLQEEYNMQADDKFESVSPPLQEMSPTTSEPMPLYNRTKLVPVNKVFNRDDINRLNENNDTKDNDNDNDNNEAQINDKVNDGKDPNIYKYVSFGIEIKRAMEECQNIINSYNNLNDPKEGKEQDDSPLTIEQICEAMVHFDKNSADFLDQMNSEENMENSKLAELIENMPRILANMPEIASKLSEFSNASFELPEFASIMNSLPDVNNEAQLTPETLKQIRELKLTRSRDNVKVTKNTAKRKSNRRIKNNIDSNDIMGTMTFELDSKDLTELLKDEKEIQAIMKSKPNNKEECKDLLFSISAQVVINKVFKYLRQSKSPELAKCLEEDNELFSMPKNKLNSEMYTKASTLFDNSVKDALCMDELRELVNSRFNSWKHYVATKFKSIPMVLLENEIEAMLDKFYSYIQDLAGKQCVNDSDIIVEKINELRRNKDGRDPDSEACPASTESLKQITKLLSTSAGNTFDLLIMKLSKMSQDKKSSVKSLKFNYMDVIKRCADSQQLAGWILLDPEIAANVIQELTGLPIKKTENIPDFNSMSNEKKKEYFIDRLRETNKNYMETLPKKGLTGDEWLVMLYRLEQLEDRLKDAFSKVTVTPPKPVQNQTQIASEAEILAAKGLSKIIGKANVKIVKKDAPKPKVEEKTPDWGAAPNQASQTHKAEIDDKKLKNENLLMKCEAILTSKGEKSLLDSFYTIKSYITQGLPVPDTYKKHVISICSSIDAKFLNEEFEESSKEDKYDDDKAPLSVIGSQNPELLAKYSAQALRNAKQTLNAVAFKNMMKNGQSKSESDTCDTPKSDCKWTSDCICNSCKDSDNSEKGKNGLEEKKKEVKKQPVQKPVKPQAKCENSTHQQHVCKG